MRFRVLVSSLFALSSVAAWARAQGVQGDPYADGLMPGDYIRLGAGIISPVHPRGSLSDWNRGNILSLVWEGWQPGASTVGRVGFGVGVDYGRLPLNQAQFIADFQTAPGIHPTAANASSATAFSISTNIRVRIPAPLVMPSLEFGFGYMDFRPNTIQYSSPTGNGSATQQHRRGAEFTVGAGLDKQLVDRFALYGEALYAYGLTSLGHGAATPGGTCFSNQCDPLQNTAFAVVRGGLRVRVGN